MITPDDIKEEVDRLMQDRDTAYDGFSKRRPRRALKPLERDILCRILGEILYEIEIPNRRPSLANEKCGFKTGGLMFECQWHGLRLDEEEIPILREIRDAINPRPDGE